MPLILAGFVSFFGWLGSIATTAIAFLATSAARQAAKTALVIGAFMLAFAALYAVLGDVISSLTVAIPEDVRGVMGHFIPSNFGMMVNLAFSYWLAMVGYGLTTKAISYFSNIN